MQAKALDLVDAQRAMRVAGLQGVQRRVHQWAGVQSGGWADHRHDRPRLFH